ncbi:MAG: hypothetical protein QS98_C0012G0043 [archaeon GW2011_AR3]|nr:MAG: hypothetical protein QS98_C0012G0043 [archaeon GW2011_AR3]MBS3109025.1 hypothetical protein [Candidatus Woesearchaeota archaeon]
MSDFKYTRKYFETEMEKGMTDYQKKEFHRIKRREFLKHAGMGAVGMLLAIKTIPFEHIGSYALKSFTGETEEHEQREFYLKRWDIEKIMAEANYDQWKQASIHEEALPFMPVGFTSGHLWVDQTTKQSLFGKDSVLNRYVLEAYGRTADNKRTSLTIDIIDNFDHFSEDASDTRRTDGVVDDISLILRASDPETGATVRELRSFWSRDSLERFAAWEKHGQNEYAFMDSPYFVPDYRKTREIGQNLHTLLAKYFLNDHGENGTTLAPVISR